MQTSGTECIENEPCAVLIKAIPTYIYKISMSFGSDASTRSHVPNNMR